MIDFFEFSNEMLCLADHRGYFTRVNQAWTKTLGWSADELVSRPYFDFVHPDDLEATVREASLLLTGSHETVLFENRYRCLDGSYRWMAWRAVLAPGTQQLVASARDITDQKLQAQALHASEERFRLLATRAPVGIAQADAAGSIFFVNAAWCELAGVSPEEALGYSWQQFIHQDDLPAVILHWQTYLNAGQDVPPDEFRFVHRNGDIRWASSSVALLKDDGGRVVGQIATVQDITDRKTVELRFRGIYERAPLGIALIDSHTGRFLQVNPKYLEITGRTEEEMLNLHFQSITHPDDVEADLNNIASLLKNTTRHFHKTKRYVRGDGSIVWVNLTAVAMWQTGETPVCHLAMVEDITEHKAAEDALREVEERFRAFMDNTPAIAWAKDDLGRHVYLNKAYEERFQVRLDEWLGKTDFDVWPRKLAQENWDSDRKVLANAEPIQETEELLSADSKPLYWFTTKFLFQDRRNRRYVGGVGIDVTELKRTELSLRSEQDLLRSLIEVQENEKQFLCQEFHDGLIQYVVGSVMLLESCQNDPDSAESRSKLEMAIGNLRRGVEDGRRVIRGIRPAVLDDSGLKAAIDDLIGQFTSSGIMITSECDPQIGRLPNSIQTTIFRVVQEALNNAKKYSGTDVVRISLRQPHGELLLEIRDFGCGFHVESARKRGFGLLGMTERVRLLGGECQIDSEPDAGTRISVRLPIHATSDGA